MSFGHTRSGTHVTAGQPQCAESLRTQFPNPLSNERLNLINRHDGTVRLLRIQTDRQHALDGAFGDQHVRLRGRHQDREPFAHEVVRFFLQLAIPGEID